MSVFLRSQLWSSSALLPAHGRNYMMTVNHITWIQLGLTSECSSPPSVRTARRRPVCLGMTPSLCSSSHETKKKTSCRWTAAAAAAVVSLGWAVTCPVLGPKPRPLKITGCQNKPRPHLFWFLPVCSPLSGGTPFTAPVSRCAQRLQLPWEAAANHSTPRFSTL